MADTNGRRDAGNEAKDVSDNQIGQDEMPCLAQQVVPRLTDLAVVNGALVGGAPAYWTTVHNASPATVRAATQPPNATGIVWDGDHLGAAPTQRTVSRAAVGRFTVGATLNNPRLEVQIHVFDLTGLVSDLPIVVAGTTRKGYAGFIPGNIATLTATTNPADRRVWTRLAWSAGSAGAQANLRQVTVAAAGDQTVRVTLGTPAIGPLWFEAVLHICEWPLLEVSQLTFSQGHVINNDTVADFDRRWTRARVGQTASDRFNPPQCYTRNTTIELAARLRVTRQPTEAENVTVRGTATIGGVLMTWTSALTAVNPGAAAVDVAAVLANNPLPNQVGYHQAAQINWEMSNPVGGWITIGNTTHDFYVTLGDPIVPGPVYWTLLHYSCVNGAGTAAPGAFADAAFNSYTGRNMRRKRDNKPMTYWDPRSVARGNHDTARLLGSDTKRQWNPADPDGTPSWFREAVATGHCGAWASSFIDMLKIHGVATGHKVNVTNRLPMVRAAPSVLGPVAAGGFLVATWNFAPPVLPHGAALTHEYLTDCTPGAYAPGQNNPTPPPKFINHFVVWCTTNGTLYDPSYGQQFNAGGVGAILLAWEMNSISGLWNDSVPAPNTGYATAALLPPGRRLRFRDLTTGLDL
jgi:hypothetical protein